MKDVPLAVKGKQDEGVKKHIKDLEKTLKEELKPKRKRASKKKEA